MKHIIRFIVRSFCFHTSSHLEEEQFTDYEGNDDVWSFLVCDHPRCQKRLKRVVIGSRGFPTH